MISGKVGSTKKTLVSSDSTVVGEAPEVRGRNPDEYRQHGGDEASEHRDHQRFAGAVDQLGVHVLAQPVVPSQCWVDGCSSGVVPTACGSPCSHGTNKCGTSARTTKRTKRASPTHRLAIAADRPPQTAAARRRGRGRRAGSRAGVRRGSRSWRLPLRPGARVEQEHREVADQDADEHRDRDQQEQRLEQRVVGGSSSRCRTCSRDRDS